MATYNIYSVCLLDEVVDPLNGVHRVWGYLMDKSTVATSTKFWWFGQSFSAGSDPSNGAGAAPAATGASIATMTAAGVHPVTINVGPQETQAASNLAVKAAWTARAASLIAEIKASTPVCAISAIPSGTIVATPVSY